MPAVKHNKQNVSVTLDPILVKQAREIGINLSQTLTSALKSEIHSIEMDFSLTNTGRFNDTVLRL